ncbi:tyrosine-type recombinase/integrase [Thermodesulfobacteriota bacterium]
MLEHELRYTFASQMIMRGASLKEVQGILGHKNITTTMMYSYLSKEHKKKWVNRLNGLTTLRDQKKSTCHKTVTFSESLP